jgi:hypothetical protein
VGRVSRAPFGPPPASTFEIIRERRSGLEPWEGGAGVISHHDRTHE